MLGMVGACCFTSRIRETVSARTLSKQKRGQREADPFISCVPVAR